jgi:hypothetical protein
LGEEKSRQATKEEEDLLFHEIRGLRKKENKGFSHKMRREFRGTEAILGRKVA